MRLAFRVRGNAWLGVVFLVGGARGSFSVFVVRFFHGDSARADAEPVFPAPRDCTMDFRRA